jgi:UDP-glucose 4-epimerase
MNEHEQFYKDKKILVTGGAGSIGTNLVRSLVNLDPKMVMILDNMTAGYEWNIPNSKKVMLIKGDITSDIDLKRVFNEKPDVVYHLAAFFANQNSVDYPEEDLKTNGMGTLKIFEYATLTKTERVVYASSGCSIYGHEAPLPLREEFMSMHLTTPYQITKSLGEYYANFFHHHFGLKVVKTRFFNSYGPGEVPGQYRNVIPNFIYWAMKGLPLPIAGNPDATRDFCYVGDIVNGLLRAGFYEGAIGKEMNLASGVETRIGDLATKINTLTGNKGGTVMMGKRVWDTKSRLLASVERANKLIGYQPQMKFDEGLKNAIQWFKDNWDNIERSASFPPGASSAVR